MTTMFLVPILILCVFLCLKQQFCLNITHFLIIFFPPPPPPNSVKAKWLTCSKSCVGWSTQAQGETEVALTKRTCGKWCTDSYLQHWTWTFGHQLVGDWLGSIQHCLFTHCTETDCHWDVIVFPAAFKPRVLVNISVLEAAGKGKKIKIFLYVFIKWLNQSICPPCFYCTGSAIQHLRSRAAGVLLQLINLLSTCCFTWLITGGAHAQSGSNCGSRGKEWRL